MSDDFGERQQRGLDELAALARKEYYESVPQRPDPDLYRRRSNHRSLRSDFQVHVAPGEGTPGALTDFYPIPRARLHRQHTRWAVTSAALLAAVALSQHMYYMFMGHQAYRLLMAIWTLNLAFMAAQWLISWRDRPWTVSAKQRRSLDRLRVVVNVPLYNEEPFFIDRCLWALVNQSRPPQRIHVVDDGSTIDYRQLRSHWDGWHGNTEVTWTRQANAGKKHAQIATFTSDLAADVFVTIDSDTCLEARALEEGLKPFAHRSVMSVAGVALALNSGVNWLTRTVSARDLFFQLVARGAQSSFGDVLVNSGAFALYRSSVIREIVPAYVNETFFGHPVKLGDDATLTLFARGAGRAVQQCSAFAYTMNPERLSHHFRQWNRWMRGATIRNCWRVRYLPLFSFGWLSTVVGFYSFLASLALPILIAAMWPMSAQFAEYAVGLMVCWSYLTALRVTAVRRSDENWGYRVGTWLSYLPGAIWGLFILRPLRLYGMATCMRQGWTTRTSGAESLGAPNVGYVGEGRKARGRELEDVLN